MNQIPPVVAVLDDEPQMRKALRRLLGSHGFRVDDYEHGDVFLEAIPSQPADCVVLDLHMPGISGFDVLAALAVRQITTPVIVLAGHDEPGAEERTLVMGASAYLKKPVDETSLLLAIKLAIALHQSHPGGQS